MTATVSPTQPLLIDARQAAAMLSISARKLWSLTQANGVPHRRIGSRVLYPVDELRQWIDAGCPATK